MTAWAAVISWLLVILGWFIINRQNNIRETRKEIRAALNQFYDVLNEIEDDAVTYHSGGAGDPVLSRRIKRRLGQLHGRAGLALGSTIECSCSREIWLFRQAVTLENFDTAAHKMLPASDPIFEEITATKERLVQTLERAFLRTYR